LKEEYIKWYSSLLERDIEMLSFGNSGLPVILFPTSMGRYFQYKDHKLVLSAASLIEQGLIKIYCPDSFDAESWYNKMIPPVDRIRQHLLYEKMIMEDVVKLAISETGHSKVAMAGCSLGAYHAANFSFKFPSFVSNLICMSGTFDIQFMLDGYSDEICSSNNPVEYIDKINDPELKNLEVILGVGDNDFTKFENLKLAALLCKKGINHRLDIKECYDHDWHSWRQMFPLYLRQIQLEMTVFV
jgi:esterase/lipase superfamily enzyme